jgi:hypothetical protein
MLNIYQINIKITDFVVENLSFKGKKRRTREFRRRNNNWAYRQEIHLPILTEKLPSKVSTY